MQYLCIVHVCMYTCTCTRTYPLCGYTCHLRTVAILVNRPSGISQAAAVAVNRTQGVKQSLQKVYRCFLIENVYTFADYLDCVAVGCQCSVNRLTKRDSFG